MKNIFKLFILLAFSYCSLGQNYEWTKVFGGYSFVNINSTQTDQQGNLVVIGFFFGSEDFDPGPGVQLLNSNGQYDVFIQKFNPNGDLLWAKSFGGSLSDYTYAMDVDQVGNIYLTGTFSGTVDFNPGSGTVNKSANGLNEIYVLKLNSAGVFKWVRTFGRSSGVRSIAVNENGDVYTSGDFTETKDFNPGSAITNLVSNGIIDVFVHKMDSNGNFLWAKSFGGDAIDYATVIDFDPSGNIYISGKFQGTSDFDPSTTSYNLSSNGGYDIYINKLNNQGDLIWAKSFGGLNGESAEDLSIDKYGNIVTTGVFHDSTDFDPGPNTSVLYSNQGNDIFVQKLDSNGNFIWVKSFDGTNSNLVNSMAIDTFGSIYTVGGFIDTIDFDPSINQMNKVSQGSNDIFIHKMDQAGNLKWIHAFGSTTTDIGIDISLDDMGNVYTAGFLSGLIDFDPTIGVDTFSPVGPNDLFIQKMSQCFIFNGNDSILSCEPYTWIDGNTYSTANNTATHTLQSIAGCDSIVTLNLTIGSVSDLSTVLTNQTINSLNNDASYQWLDCDNGYSPIPGETNQSFIATVNGNYAVQLTENGCVDTSACVNINNVSIHENTAGNIQVYPNPTEGLFTITLVEKYNHIKVQVSDITGRLISNSLYQDAENINLELNEPRGIYLITIETEKKKRVVKLVKE
jgi:hypothetical protein